MFLEDLLSDVIAKKTKDPFGPFGWLEKLCPRSGMCLDAK